MIRNKFVFAFLLVISFSLLVHGKKKKKNEGEGGNAAALKKCSKEEKKLVKCVNKGIFEVDLQSMGTVAEDIIKSFRSSKDYKKLTKEALELDKDKVINEFLMSDEFLELSAAHNAKYITSEEGEAAIKAATMELYVPDAAIVVTEHEEKLSTLEKNAMEFVKDVKLYFSFLANTDLRVMELFMSSEDSDTGEYFIDFMPGGFQAPPGFEGPPGFQTSTPAFVYDDKYRYVNPAYMWGVPVMDNYGPPADGPPAVYDPRLRNRMLDFPMELEGTVMDSPPFTGIAGRGPQAPQYEPMARYGPLWGRMQPDYDMPSTASSIETIPQYEPMARYGPLWGRIQPVHDMPSESTASSIETIEVKNILEIMNPMGYLIPKPQTELPTIVDVRVPALIDVPATSEAPVIIEDPWAEFIKNTHEDELEEEEEDKYGWRDDETVREDQAVAARKDLVGRMKFFMK